MYAGYHLLSSYTYSIVYGDAVLSTQYVLSLILITQVQISFYTKIHLRFSYFYICHPDTSDFKYILLYCWQPDFQLG